MLNTSRVKWGYIFSMANGKPKQPRKQHKFDEEIISGSIFRSIWKVAWPVIITQLVAGIHAIVDHALVGNFVGYEAPAAIGSSWQLFLVVVVFLSSLFHGMSIFIAQYAGRQDHEAVNRIWAQVLMTSAYLLVLVVAPAGYLLTPHMLDWIATTPEVKRHALPYLRILFTCSFPLFLMFVLNWAMQASGNPKIPMFLGVLTTAVNIVVSFILITGTGPFPELGTSGAAIGTAFGPVPSMIIAFWLIARGKVVIGFPDEWSFRPDFELIRRVAAVGVPAGIQAVTLNIGGAILIYFINQLQHEAAALSAYVICYTQLFAVVTWTSFGLRAACATVMGQNIGAGKTGRGERAVYIGAGIGFLWAAFFGIFYWTIPGPLLSIFGMANVETVRPIASQLLRFLTFSGVFVAMALAFTGGLQGAGDTKKPMFIAFVTQIVILLGICMIFLQLGRLSPVVIWSAILISHVSRLTLTYIVFAGGGWRDIRVSLEERAQPPVQAPILEPNPEEGHDSVSSAGP